MPVLRQNQFGFVVGGPVYIPKLYDGRNKTSSWPTTRAGASSTAPVHETVPNPALLTGDFSDETYPPGVGGLPGGPLPAYGTPACATLLAMATTACR